tara:strand:+ start:637 stop:948 length:312 start_codon:yes stop_codon:yes gene_type:complete
MIQESMKCTECGVSEEFETCAPDGTFMEPTAEWNNDWKCLNCGNVQSDTGNMVVCPHVSPFYGQCELVKGHKGKHDNAYIKKPFFFSSRKESEMRMKIKRKGA